MREYLSPVRDRRGHGINLSAPLGDEYGKLAVLSRFRGHLSESNVAARVNSFTKHARSKLSPRTLRGVVLESVRTVSPY